MNKNEVIFIPSPGTSHLASTLEIAKLLVSREESISISILVIKLPIDKLKPPSDSISGIQIVELPQAEFSYDPSNPNAFLTIYIDNHKKHVRDAAEKIATSGTTRLAAIVVDMFCTSMIDVAKEFGVPSYLFFTSGAASLGLMFHLQSLRDDHNQDVTEYRDSLSDAELLVPTYSNPVPAKVLPAISIDKRGGSAVYLGHTKRFRETKGIIINTFLDFEIYALDALASEKNIPPIHPVGPILKKSMGPTSLSPEGEVIIKWLDDHLPSSVVFLCFGSMGSFQIEQVKEIANALERSGHPFLWSLRRGAPQGMGPVSDYEDFEQVLPEGFLQRTQTIGKVIGWAPQMAVLSHPSVGGFVSHCGWNSTLESVWCGVPMATWPLYAEQQANAFQLVKELEMAVEIKMDYKKDFWSSSVQIVTAEQIENGIRRLMDPGNEIRQNVKWIKQKARMALEEGGSSYASLRSVIDEFMGKN